VNRRAGVFALGAYALLLYLTAPAWPDDWDGVGFLESVQYFDLARFQPHPPGYPVYVALLRVAELVTRAPMRACVVVAVASGVVAVAFAWSTARSAVGTRGAWVVAMLAATTPLAWRVCSGVGSEAPALACAAACAWGLVSARRTPWAGALALGLGVGLGLGVNPGLGRCGGVLDRVARTAAVHRGRVSPLRAHRGALCRTCRALGRDRLHGAGRRATAVAGA
jgi:hypothetical protein